ncbi:6078_t:CDS:2, partial [Paraglomus brasilianum]
APGRGKTALMQRGIIKVMMCESFKELWTGRTFAWDLEQNSITEAEQKQFIGPIGHLDNVAGAQHVLALRCLHQSIDGNRPYINFLIEFECHLQKNGLDFSNITLEAIFDHVLQGAALPTSTTASATSPNIVLFHISKTNQLLKDEPYSELQLLMKAAYGFNKDMAQGCNNNYMLLMTFDGTHRVELLQAFRESNMQCCRIDLHPATVEMYTEVLQRTARKASKSGIQCDTELQNFVPPEPFKAALADCGDNMHLFTLLVYHIGCHNSNKCQFSWSLFFENLKLFTNNVPTIALWMCHLRDTIVKCFGTYTDDLLRLDSNSLLCVLVPVVLGQQINDVPSKVVGDSSITWLVLEKSGAISLCGQPRPFVKLPFVFIQMYLQEINDGNQSVIDFIHLLDDINNESNPCQNEKCDLAIVTFQLLHWHFNYEGHEVFNLSDVFQDVRGTAAKMSLKLPAAFKRKDLLKNWIQKLCQHFDPNLHLTEGAYIGVGNEKFADSWIVFERSRSDGIVVLAIESKHHARTEPLTKEYFNLHKKKVNDKLPHGTPFVFMMVADMVTDNISAGHDEIVVGNENMESLYGSWLLLRRQLALRHT